MPKPLSESLHLHEATASTDSETGLLEVEFITPGWGSSGYYSREVVEAAAPLFAVGTHMYFDHPTASENADRPERSVRDLAAVITEAGTVDKTTGGVRGKVQPLAPYRQLLTDETFAKNVGVSIRGSASDIVLGEAEGRRGPIVEGLEHITSVDFVTRAGRGGKVLQVLESERFVNEATADDRARQLSDAVRAAYSGEDQYAWVMDQDAERQVVWYQLTGSGAVRSRTFEQTYDVGDNDVDITLTGDPLEVSRVTKYVPVNPAGRTTTQESEEDTMPQIEEARLRQLEEAAGRVTTLEERATTAEAENKALKEAAVVRGRTDRALTIVAERAKAAEVTFTPREVKGFVADITLTESGEFDEAAFTKLVDEDAAHVKVARGVGNVTGFGGGVVDQTVTEADAASAVAGAFGRTVKGA